MPGAPLLEVGQVLKPHGLSGAVVVKLVTNRTERLDPGSKLVGEDRSGTRLELEVEGSSPHLGRHIVRFAGCSSMDRAEALRGTVLRALPLEPEDGAFFVHELIGAVVRDQTGTERGRVVAVEANPASDLLVLEPAAYVPLRFVVAREPGCLIVEVPDGLFE